MKYLVLILLAIPLILIAQQQLPPCGYGVYPCINPGSGPIILDHPNDDPSVQQTPQQQMQGDNQSLEIYRDQQEWLFARRWVDFHGCGGSKGFRGLRWTERFSLGSHPTLRQKVAYICNWR